MSPIWRTRSAQFGVYDLTLQTVRDYYGPTSENDKKRMYYVDYQVVLAGLSGPEFSYS